MEMVLITISAGVCGLSLWVIIADYRRGTREMAETDAWYAQQHAALDEISARITALEAGVKRRRG